jgi:hypothetical protein
LAGLWHGDLQAVSGNRWANAKFWQTLGYEENIVTDQPSPWLAALGPDNLAATVSHINACVADRSYSFDQVVRDHHLDGSTQWLHCWGFVLRDEAGRPHRLLGVLVDSTRQRNEEVTAQEVATHYGAILASQSAYIIKTALPLIECFKFSQVTSPVLPVRERGTSNSLVVTGVASGSFAKLRESPAPVLLLSIRTRPNTRT